MYVYFCYIFIFNILLAHSTLICVFNSDQNIVISCDFIIINNILLILSC